MKLILVGVMILASGCASLQNRGIVDHNNEIVGTGVTNNPTMKTSLLMCVGDHINSLESKTVTIAVGMINDATGKYSIDSGTRVTQGARSMVSSAVSKTSAFRMVERQFQSVSEYDTNMRFGSIPVNSLNTSDFYIVGDITELNYNIDSGGHSLNFGMFSSSARTYVMNIAIDLRLIHTKTSDVIKVASLQKQIRGYETSAGIFKFFGTNKAFRIMDGDKHSIGSGEIGRKMDEPLQLGIRTVLEQATAELLGYLYQVPVSEYSDSLSVNMRDMISTPRKHADEVCGDMLPKDAVPQIKLKPKFSHSGACGINKMVVVECDCELDELSEPMEATPGWYVQTSTQTSKSRAMNERNCLENGLVTKGLFGNTGWLLRGSGNKYPVISGKFETKADATEQCDIAHGLGLECIIVNIK